MKTLKLRNQFQTDSTLIENEFIDQHMVDANGEFVKVYLFLLRHLHNPRMPLTISTIADCLQNTEKDILRALNYWQKEGLLGIEYDASGNISGITMGSASVEETTAEEAVIEAIPEPVPVKVVASEPSPSEPTNIEPFRNRKELKSLLFVAEQYLGKTLSPKDIETINYFYDGLHFSADLVEYLIEYCVENGHKSMHYIQKVALAWSEANISTVDQAKNHSSFYNKNCYSVLNACVENGHKSMHYIQKVALAWSEANISTVDQAKNHSSFYNKNCYSVLNAFGIKGRGPAAPELTYINKWTSEYGFTLDIVIEACNRTMAKLHQPNFEAPELTYINKWTSEYGFTLDIVIEACNRTMAKLHQPNFEYADSILRKWRTSNVHHLSDLDRLDLAHKQTVASRKSESRSSGKNKFNNFEGRTYDYDSLEKQLLSQ